MTNQKLVTQTFLGYKLSHILLHCTNSANGRNLALSGGDAGYNPSHAETVLPRNDGQWNGCRVALHLRRR
jgi:hypothetical protein